jgi:hypothetical protein
VADSEQISRGWESAANFGLPLARSGHIEVLGKRRSYIKLLEALGRYQAAEKAPRRSNASDQVWAHHGAGKALSTCPLIGTAQERYQVAGKVSVAYQAAGEAQGEYQVAWKEPGAYQRLGKPQSTYQVCGKVPVAYQHARKVQGTAPVAGKAPQRYAASGKLMEDIQPLRKRREDQTRLA